MERVPHKVFTKSGHEWHFKRYGTDEVFSLVYGTEYDTQCGLAMSPRQVEAEFTRVGRPEPKSKILVQGKYECAAAALAMLLDESLFNVKRAMGKQGWRNDDKGAGDRLTMLAARSLGRDIIRIDKSMFTENMGPCTVSLPSLNMKGMGHAITWNGKEILDPNYGRPGRLFWGPEWHPTTIGAWHAHLLLDFTLSEQERKELDEWTKKKEEKVVNKIKEQIILQLAGNQ